jgi:hypothetical protein
MDPIVQYNIHGEYPVEKVPVLMTTIALQISMNHKIQSQF